MFDYTRVVGKRAFNPDIFHRKAAPNRVWPAAIVFTGRGIVTERYLKQEHNSKCFGDA